MKNKLLYVLFMILILPFFVILTLSLRKTGNGDILIDSFYSFEVEKTDGETDPEGFDFKFSVFESGNVTMNYSWDVEDPGYITCFTITDEDGESVFSSSGFQLSEDEIILDLKEGKYYGSLRFISDEDEFRDFCDENNMLSSQAIRESYINQVGFDTFEEDADSVFEFSVDITGSAPAPFWMKALALILGVVETGLLILLLIFDKNGDENIKDRMNSVALRYSIFGLAVTISQVIFSYLFSAVLVNAPDELKTNMSFFLIILTVDIIGFPLILLLCRNIPVNRIEKRKIGFGMYLAYALMTVGLIFVGAIIGIVIHMMFSLSAADTTSLADLLYNSSPLPRILTVGILAPIFEELIFRKTLIDHLNKYGALISVLASGLFFGLFHGNFQQFFFAAFVGCLWAVLYLKTGKIHLTIGLHMMINTGTSAITTFLLGNVMDGALLTGEVTDDMALKMLNDPYFIVLTLWLLFIVFAAIAGLILFIIFACTGKLKITENTVPAQNMQWEGYAPVYAYGTVPQQAPGFTQEYIPEVKPADKPVAAFFGAKYTWAFILVCVGLFLMSYI